MLQDIVFDSRKPGGGLDENLNESQLEVQNNANRPTNVVKK